MKEFYTLLTENNYFWDRKDDKTIYVALNGYKVFSQEYEDMMAAAKEAKATNIAAEFDTHSLKTFYYFKHK